MEKEKREAQKMRLVVVVVVVVVVFFLFFLNTTVLLRIKIRKRQITFSRLVIKLILSGKQQFRS